MGFRRFIGGFILFTLVLFGLTQGAHAFSDDPFEKAHEKYAAYINPKDPEAVLNNIHKILTCYSIITGKVENCAADNLLPQNGYPQDFKDFILFVQKVDPVFLTNGILVNIHSKKANEYLQSVNSHQNKLPAFLNIALLNLELKEITKETREMNDRLLYAMETYGINVSEVTSNDKSFKPIEDKFAQQMTGTILYQLKFNGTLDTGTLKEVIGLSFTLNDLMASITFHIGDGIGGWTDPTGPEYFSFINWADPDWNYENPMKVGGFQTEKVWF